MVAQATTKGGVASILRPLIGVMFGDEVPVRIQYWDGSGQGPTDGPGTVHVRSADALRHLLWSPGELGVGRAFVAGHLDVEGDAYATLKLLGDAGPDHQRLSVREVAAVAGAARSLGVLKGPLPPPEEEVRPRGWVHSRGSDSRAIGHHYDVGNDFYRLMLGPSMTYSCARFTSPGLSLEDAQTAKFELICRKLGLHERVDDGGPGPVRLLDVGCGWGSLAIHAAAHHGAQVVGITISRAQAELARKRVAEAGMADRVEIRIQDYRDIAGEEFDAISSVGMFEHVGASRMAQYFDTLRPLLGPEGRLLNHAISVAGGSRLRRRSFMFRYVFPDAELVDVGEVVLAMERAGFEVRDVESLREHYARTVRHWIANLEAAWDDAVAEVGLARARIWWLYSVGVVNSFDDGGMAVHQVLGVVPHGDGRTGMPQTRASWG
ncbi:MAG: cyclopropane-fatty-acyl-phospholipid synthase [Actinomycetota bacterium]|jgi:cyclopropane-fatty-acyl-phospholipid synthase|nr:cyclopropane-fatty-acyl-phospholipid synthase [Actinomycetota bacterium]